jgi:type VI secretion system protein ImpI
MSKRRGDEKTAMELILQLVNETTLPDGGPVSCRVTGKRNIDIGRAAHLDWTLPDPTRFISSKHCEIRYRDGAYWLHDVSTNGTFLNGANDRMRAPHRLRNGDRFNVGHYIVAATLDGLEETGDEGLGTPPSAAVSSNQGLWNDQQLWVSEGEVPAPIDPKVLRPPHNDAPVHPDFLDWAADVSDPSHPSVADADLHPRPPTQPMPAQPSSFDWAEGPPSNTQTPPTSTSPLPSPRRPGWDASESKASFENAPIMAKPAPGAAVGGTPVSQELTAERESLAAFLRQFAKSAGIPEDLLTQKDPDQLAQQIGRAIGLLAENLMQLLSARRQAKQLARSSSHTTIQPSDNNPLKFCPSAGDALRIMFGPKSVGYLDAHRAIAQGFEDLKAHQIKTYAAMQHALTCVIADLDPKTIERETNGGGGIGSLLQVRKAKLWDAYEARWQAKLGLKSSEAIDAFMRYFGEYYDRDRE